MKLTRRKLLVATGVVGGGLALGFYLNRSEPPLPQTAAGSFQPNAWLQITSDGRVIFQLDKAEMGQGVYTGLTTIVGEALDYHPANIQVEMAGVHPAYNNPAMGMQITGGSTSIATGFEPLSNAGATARAMLLAAAARQWEVPVAELTTDDGQVVHQASGKTARYGDLADAAKDITPPEQVTLKDPRDYRWLGRSLPGFDAPPKVNGSARFGMDVMLSDRELPAMKTAVVVRCPHFGGSLVSFDASAAADRAGVQKIFAIHNGVAVVADGYWQARQAADQIDVEWDKGPLAGLSSAAILDNQTAALDNTDDLVEAISDGDADSVWQTAQGDSDRTQTLEVRYSAPFLHHSTMEPQNCTALVIDDHCEIWAPSQAPGFAQAAAAQFGGFDPAKVRVHTTFLGGGFGRRAMTDFAGEAAAIAKQLPGVPIKLQWSREDDMRHDFYRPSTLHRLRAVVDRSGEIKAWRHRIVSASIIKGFAATLVGGYLPAWLPEAMGRGIGRIAGSVAAGRDPTLYEGAEIPYTVANKKVDVALYDPGIPLGFWRSVGHSHNAFVVEGFMDELAHLANRDPVEFRRQYLQQHPRHAQVLAQAAAAANWGELATDRYQGVAVHESFGSYVAEVVEVSKTENGHKIERVVCAVDCGRVINPDKVVAQVESAVIYGLTAALKAPVTIDDGRVVESNFHDLPVLRMDETPAIEVVLVHSDEKPTGVGEIALPPLAPALANALFRATGERQRDLPLKLS